MNTIEDIIDVLAALGYTREVEAVAGGQWAKETWPGHSVVVKIDLVRDTAQIWHRTVSGITRRNPMWRLIGTYRCTDGLILEAHICGAEERSA